MILGPNYLLNIHRIRMTRIKWLGERIIYLIEIFVITRLSISSFSSQEQVLVFCSSKVEVEKTATLIAKTIDVLIKVRRRRRGKGRGNDEYPIQSGSPIRSLLDLRSLLNLKIEIEKRARHLDSLLLKTLPRGVAFHHAGIEEREREREKGSGEIPPSSISSSSLFAPFRLSNSLV